MKLNVLQKFILLFSICVVSFSCSDDNNDNSIKEELSLENLVLSESQLNTIGTKISGLQQRGTQSRFSQEQMNNEMEIILQPMVDNGREIYNEIINNVDLQNSEYELNNEDIASIQNLDDKQLAQLSYIASLAYSSEINESSTSSKMSSPDPTVRACLATAVGITAIYDLIQNTRALGTVTSTVRALKLIGRRYLGWIGVGLMIYDFMDCYYGLTN